MTAPTCATCRWRQRNGECRRMPPIESREMTERLDSGWMVSHVGGVWPYVKPDDWCGEHAPKGEG